MKELFINFWRKVPYGGYFLTVIANFTEKLLAGISIHLVLSVSGIVFLGLPTVVKVADYALAISERSGIIPELAWIIAVFVAVLTSFFFALLFVRVSSYSFEVLGLGSLLAIEALAKSLDWLTNGTLGISGIQRPAFLQDMSVLIAFFTLVAFVLLLGEYFLLQTPFGRTLRAYREDPLVLDNLGCNSQRAAQKAILLSGFVVSVSGIFFVWRVQFLDPSGLFPFLIEILTLATIALKPRVRMIAFAAFFSTLVPEILRFLQIPGSILGYVRILLFSLLLIILL